MKKVNEILSQRCDDKNHIGLRSVHERIQLNYGKAYGISIKSEPGEGTCVHMILPFEKYFKEEAPDENSNDC